MTPLPTNTDRRSVYDKDETRERLGRGRCEFTTCDADDTITLRHTGTDATFEYCEDHAPSGDVWEAVDD